MSKDGIDWYAMALDTNGFIAGGAAAAGSGFQGRFYPSSKLCSDCGAHNAELGREPHWTCSQCSVRHDRNDNAALNLLGVALEAALNCLNSR